VRADRAPPLTPVRKPLLKKILWGLLGLVLAAATFAVVSIGPRNIVGILRYDQRREGNLRAGDLAPDVTLGTIDDSGEDRLLAHLAGRPLILIFGSYT
jgi:hypothetical protein